MTGRSPTMKTKESAGARAASCRERPTRPVSSRGPAVASASPRRRMSARAALDLGQDRFPARGIEGRQRLHRARPAGVPVDRLAVLVQLRIGQKVGGAIAQAAAHDAAQLRRRIVQRFAAHAQGAHAASRRDDQRGFAGHTRRKIARGLWRRDGAGRLPRPPSPSRAGRISAPCLSTSWAGRGIPRSAGTCRRRGWRGSGR